MADGARDTSTQTWLAQNNPGWVFQHQMDGLTSGIFRDPRTFAHAQDNSGLFKLFLLVFIGNESTIQGSENVVTPLQNMMSQIRKVLCQIQVTSHQARAKRHDEAKK